MLFLAIPGQLTSNITSRSSFPIWSCLTSGSCLFHHFFINRQFLLGYAAKFMESIVFEQRRASPGVGVFLLLKFSLSSGDGREQGPLSAPCRAVPCSDAGARPIPGSRRIVPARVLAGESDKPELGSSPSPHHIRGCHNLLKTHFAFAINDGNGRLILKCPAHNV